MKKSILIIFFIMLGINRLKANEIEIFKFISNDEDTIMIYKKDIISIDTAKKIIELTPEGKNKVKSLILSSVNVFFMNEENNWEKVKIINVRASERLSPFKYLLENNGSLLFYSTSHIVYEGGYVKKLVRRHEIPLKN